MKKYASPERRHELLRDFFSNDPFFQEMDAFVTTYVMPSSTKPRLKAVWLAAMEDMDKVIIFRGMGADVVDIFRKMWAKRRGKFARWGEATVYLLVADYLLSKYNKSAFRNLVKLKNMIKRYLFVYWAPGDTRQDVKRLRKVGSYRSQEALCRISDFFDAIHGLWILDEGYRGWIDLEEDFADELRRYQG